MLLLCIIPFNFSTIIFNPYKQPQKGRFLETLSEKEKIIVKSIFLLSHQPHPGGSVVSMSDSWPDGCEFDPQLRRLFFPAYFRLSPLQKHVRKVVGGCGRKSCVSIPVWESQETYASPTLDVKLALNPNTTNQSTFPTMFSTVPEGVSKIGLNSVCCLHIMLWIWTRLKL